MACIMPKKKKAAATTTSTKIDKKKLFHKPPAGPPRPQAAFPKNNRPYEFLSGVIRANPNLNPLRLPYNKYGLPDSEGYLQYVQDAERAASRDPNWRVAMFHDNNAPQPPMQEYPPQDMQGEGDPLQEPYMDVPQDMGGVDTPDDAFEQPMSDPPPPEAAMMQQVLGGDPGFEEVRPAMMRGSDFTPVSDAEVLPDLPEYDPDLAGARQSDLDEEENGVGNGSVEPRVRIIRRMRPPVTHAPSRTQGPNWFPDWVQKRDEYYEYLSRIQGAKRQRGVTYVDEYAGTV